MKTSKLNDKSSIVEKMAQYLQHTQKYTNISRSHNNIDITITRNALTTLTTRFRLSPLVHVHI